MNIALCISKFNYEFVEQIESSCFERLITLGVPEKNIRKFLVPGALELPIVLQKCAQSKKFDVLIAIGAVIRGETYHFEVVSDTSSQGIMRVQLDYSIPIINAVLTTNNDEETQERVKVKGAEAADCALQILKTLAEI